MYVTTTNPTKTVDCWYTGSQYEKCAANLVARFSCGTHTQSSGFVRSWRGRKNKRESHEFERYKFEVTGTSMLWHCNNKGYVDGGKYWMYHLNNHSLLQPKIIWSPGEFIVDQESSNQRNYVVAELYEKANAARFNSAVFVAELGETIKYVTDILKSVISITKAYRALAKRAKNSHGVWLEYRYAVMPLILTVKDALEALNPARPKEKVQNFNKYKTKSTKRHIFVYNFGTLAFVSKRTEIRRAGAAINILFQNDVAPWGTSFQDVVAAGWERVPLSFVFDWFFDVGLWLGSFRDTNLVVGDKYVTQVREGRIELWLDELGCKVGEIYKAPTKDSPFVVSGYSIRREIGDAVLPPSLPCFTPGKLSLIRKLDGLALLIGALLSLRR